MNEMLIYKLYSVVDLKNWLFNSIDNGLSEVIISKSRAYAIVNCPFATDADKVVSAVFDKGKAIGYTAVFPEKFVKPNLDCVYNWGTTQWIEPEYRGKGISAKMMLNIKNAVNNKYLGLDSSISSIKLDQKQGSKIIYHSRYFFLFNRQGHSIKLRLRVLFIILKNFFVRWRVGCCNFSNKYISFIDEKTYSFIYEHSQSSLFLRSRDFINWQLHYSFLQTVGDDKHLKDDSNQFLAYVKSQWTKAWQVYVGELMVGVCILRNIDGVCTISYLYYDEQYKNNVFASIIYIILRSQVTQLRTFSKDLFNFANEVGIAGLNSKYCVEKVALTVPRDWSEKEDLLLQGGDGDMFC